MTDADSLLAAQRKDEIRRLLQANGRVRAADLAARFTVSEDTVRRDLRDLSAAGECRRVYGGALPVAPAAGPLSARRLQASDEKAALARAAAGLFPEGATVLIDAGSTNLAVAEALPHGLALAVITNAPAIAAALLERPRIEVVLLGGKLDRETGAALGAGAVAKLARMRPDICLLGACGVDSDAGLTAFSFEDAEFKRAASSASRTVVVAATSDKLGTAAHFVVLPAQGLSALVAMQDADPAQLSAFERLGVRVLRASAGGKPSPTP